MRFRNDTGVVPYNIWYAELFTLIYVAAAIGRHSFTDILIAFRFKAFFLDAE